MHGDSCMSAEGELRARFVWLTLMYALATVLAQGAHDHGVGPDESGTHHEAGCNDPRLHLSGHPSSDSHDDLSHCLICQYRSEYHFWQAEALSASRTSLTSPVEGAPPSARAGMFRLPSCRAPPSV
jgi:hypothetical protein